METKTFVKEFKAIMNEPRERFNDAEFKSTHLVPADIVENDDFSREYYFLSDTFGFDSWMVEEYEDDWDETVENLRRALMKIEEVCCVDIYFADDDKVGIFVKVM